MKKFVTILLIAALVTAALGWAVPQYVDSQHGSDVILLVSVNDDETVSFRRDEFAFEAEDAEWKPAERRDSVISIYGANPKPETKRVLFAKDEHVIRPEEAPELVLYPQQAAGAYVYQAKSLHEVGRFVSMGAAAAFLLLALVKVVAFRGQGGG